MSRSKKLMSRSRKLHLLRSTNSSKKARIYYIDRLRLALTVLVVVHHNVWVVTNGWYPYKRPWSPALEYWRPDYCPWFHGLLWGPSILHGNVLLPLWTCYRTLTETLLKRKGTWPFLKDRRFLRLMVPTIVYEVLLFPLLIIFVTKTWYDPNQGIDTPVNDIWALYFQNYRWMPLN